MKRFNRWMVAGVVFCTLGLPSLASAQVLIRTDPVTLHTAATATGDGEPINVERWGSLGVQIDGISGDTITFEALITGTTWSSVACVKASDGTLTTAAIEDGLYRCPVAGYKVFRARISTYGAGTITVTGQLTTVVASGAGGAGGGSGTVTSVSASGGVETSSGSAITGSGTIRGNMCVRAVTGTTDTILSTDRGCLITYSNANPIAVTLPQAGTAGFDAGFYFSPVNLGAGTVTITPTTSEIQAGADLDLVTGKSATIVSSGTDYFYSPGIGLTAEAQGLDDVCTIDCEITTAVSEATGVKIGDGTNKVSQYWDPTLGYVNKPNPLSDTAWRCWTNFNCIVRDEEAGKSFLVIDPDALGAGSGTLTMQTSEQLVASNLGIKFTPSDTNPTCGTGTYGVYADTSEAKLKKCQDGTTTDLDTGGGSGYATVQEDGSSLTQRATVNFVGPNVTCVDNAGSVRTDCTVGGPVLVRKTADETVNANATAQDDNHLLFAAAANTFYAIKMFVVYSSATAADFRHDFTLPAGASGWYRVTAPTTGSTTCTSTPGMNSGDITAVNVSVGGGGVGNTCVMLLDGYVLTAGTAGTVQFQWAQATSDATDTVVLANSHLTYQAQ